MLQCPDTIRLLLPAMERGCLVLTPNHLTATQLCDWYGQWRRDEGLPGVCRTPDIYPVDIWIRQLCSRLLESGSDLLPAVRLLDPAEEHLVWHEVISSSRSGAALLNATATARAVQEAWVLEHLWCIPRTELESMAPGYAASGHDDLAAYLDWSGLFRRYCQDRQLATQVELLDTLISLVRTNSNALNLPESVVLLGFSTPPPLYAQLLNAISEVRDSQRITAAPQSPQVQVIPCDNDLAELQAAANWANTILAEVPDARIGIILNDVHQRHHELQRVFSRCFTARESRSLAPEPWYPFSLSGGKPLTRLPVIRAALDGLGRNRLTVDTLDTCRFLRSPFLVDAASERWSRACLERLLRDRNMPRTSNSDLKHLGALKERPTHCPALVAALETFDALPRPALRKNRTTRAWSALFSAQLAALGWPGQRELSEEELRGLAAWEDVLARFSRLAPVFGELPLENALAILLRLTESHILRANHDSSTVRILSPLEADGLHFTHCRLLGLSEQQWPPPPRVTPFIPFSVLKAKGLPETDATLYAEQTRQTLAGLVARTADEVVFSYPCQRDDIPLKPALILRQYQGDDPGDVGRQVADLRHPSAADLFEQDATEQLADNPTLPLTDLDRLSGGSLLLADQAECPFRSFINHRLQARPLEKLVYGLSPRAAGTLVHLTLDLLWQTLTSQAALLAMPEADLKALVERVVNAAVSDMRQKHFHTMTDSFCALEEIRLQELLLQWLEEERQRGSFTVLAGELDTRWHHGGLTLNLRIDRVDQTPEGDLVLVDYKTARNTRVDWEDERPANSQLMLYALAVTQAGRRQDMPELTDPTPVSGVYFAQVNIENTRYTGLSRKTGIYPGSGVEELRGKWRGLSESATWDTLSRGWENSLAALADEFLNGCVSITPKSRQCCEYCHARPVCRIDDGGSV